MFSGGLSAFLDNAPTYATFYEMAAQLPGDPRIGAAPGVPEAYLIAISLGSVLCGAITYIGNGPNFMTKAVADAAGVPMPSFGGYMRWSILYLVPILAAMVAIFLADGPSGRSWASCSRGIAARRRPPATTSTRRTGRLSRPPPPKTRARARRVRSSPLRRPVSQSPRSDWALRGAGRGGRLARGRPSARGRTQGRTPHARNGGDRRS